MLALRYKPAARSFAAGVPVDVARLQVRSIAGAGAIAKVAVDNNSGALALPLAPAVELFAVGILMVDVPGRAVRKSEVVRLHNRSERGRETID